MADFTWANFTAFFSIRQEDFFPLSHLTITDESFRARPEYNSFRR